MINFGYMTFNTITKRIFKTNKYENFINLFNKKYYKSKMSKMHFFHFQSMTILSFQFLIVITQTISIIIQ